MDMSSIIILPECHILQDKDNPRVYELMKYAEHTAVHSCTIHFYLAKFGLQINDNEVPHDLVGEGNKLEWLVMRGLALKEIDSEEKQKRLDEALKRHRMQRHHRMWNVQNPDATETDLKYGAIDSIISLLEKRDYQGGCHTKEQIQEKIAKNPEYKQPLMHWALENILRINKELGIKKTF